MSLCFLIFLAALRAGAQPPVEYRIQRAASPITVDAKLDEAAWSQASPTSPFVFNWFTSGEKEPTEAKLLWDDDNLYVSWRCQDRHISAFETKRHGAVSRDDCVEIFLSPNPAKVKNYYTFEINAIGGMLNRCRTDWWTGGPTWEPEGVRYRTSLHGLERKEESAADREWTVELAIPFRNFAHDAAHIPPRDGDEWRLNLMRTGGKTNAQQSTWSPIAPPGRSFHSPENFGKVIFVAQAAQSPKAAAAAPPAIDPAQQRPAEGRPNVRRGRMLSEPVNAAEAAAGRELYNKSCTMCHGLDGVEGDRAPALGAQRRYLRRTEEELFDAIHNGIKGTLMPASPAPETDVRKMVAFIRSLRAAAIDSGFKGDVAKGQALFLGNGKCTHCHMLQGRGGILGPDLTNIGAQRRLEDLRASLTGTKQGGPAKGYVPVTVTMKDGRKIRGVVKNENNFSLQVLGTDDKLHLIMRDEPADIRYDSKSLMPSGLDKTLTKDEFRDLLAFLSRQVRTSR